MTCRAGCWSPPNYHRSYHGAGSVILISPAISSGHDNAVPQMDSLRTKICAQQPSPKPWTVVVKIWISKVCRVFPSQIIVVFLCAVEPSANPLHRPNDGYGVTAVFDRLLQLQPNTFSIRVQPLKMPGANRLSCGELFCSVSYGEKSCCQWFSVARWHTASSASCWSWVVVRSHVFCDLQQYWHFCFTSSRPGVQTHGAFPQN